MQYLKQAQLLALRLLAQVEAARDRVVSPAQEYAPLAAQGVRTLYLVMLFLAVMKLGPGIRIASRSGAELLWPVSWLGLVPWSAGALFVVALSGLGALAALSFPERRWARIAAFLGCFQYAALENSFGKINHSSHLFILVGFILIFLPDGETDDDATALSFNRVYWSAQAMVLMTYTMAGTSKLLGALVNIKNGTPSIFDPTGNALGVIVAANALGRNAEPILADFIITNGLLSYFLYLGAVYLEFASIAVAFRPALMRWWGIGLIGLHIGILLAMEISFATAILVVAVMVVNSPFSRGHHSLSQVLGELPGVHGTRKRLGL